MKNFLKKIENKIMTSGAAKFLAIVAVCLFALTMASAIETSVEKVSSQTEMDILKEMYHANSEDIVVAINILFVYGDSLVKCDMETIYSYLMMYGLDTNYDGSDDKFDLEIDALVYIFKDELMSNDDLKELVLKRQFLKNEMTSMGE